MFLCIDTTSAYSSITLIDSSGNENHLHNPLDPKNASEQILEVIDKLIVESGLQLSDLKCVFVIKGPGSFTGLRVGIAVANQFAHQLQIPIIGLKTDEWWKCRTDERDFIYLQSMNKSEVYISKNEKRKTKNEIIPIESLSGKKLWLGQISEDHLLKLPNGFSEITDMLSPEETWNTIVQMTKDKRQTTYKIVEPYYGKEPMITKSKKKLSI